MGVFGARTHYGRVREKQLKLEAVKRPFRGRDRSDPASRRADFAFLAPPFSFARLPF